MPSSLFGSRPTRTQPKAAQINASKGGINPKAMQSIKRMVGMFRAAKNPDAALQMMAKQNPAIREIIQVCGPGGLQNSFYQLCEEQGVNPDDILREIM